MGNTTVVHELDSTSFKSISLKLGWRNRKVYGGPFYATRNADFPQNVFRVKMAKEINLPCEVNIPTVDFSVPPEPLMQLGLFNILKAMRQGNPIYVGCMGGIGRTGLTLALLAKIFEIPNPVKFVRDTYVPHAVETSQQKEYIDNFNVTKLTALYKKYNRELMWRFWQ